MPTRSGLPSSGRKADDSPVRVDVRLDFTDRRGRWQMRCMQGSTVLRAQGDLWWMNSITELLSEIRGRFHGRRSEPSGFAEVPTTWQEWRSFIRQWLFGPPAWKQTTLKSWLRCPPRGPRALPRLREDQRAGRGLLLGAVRRGLGRASRSR